MFIFLIFPRGKNVVMEEGGWQKRRNISGGLCQCLSSFVDGVSLRLTVLLFRSHPPKLNSRFTTLVGQHQSIEPCILVFVGLHTKELICGKSLLDPLVAIFCHDSFQEKKRRRLPCSKMTRTIFRIPKVSRNNV